MDPQLEQKYLNSLNLLQSSMVAALPIIQETVQNLESTITSQAKTIKELEEKIRVNSGTKNKNL